MAVFDTTGTLYGGLAVDRAQFRERLPDAHWHVYAAGLVNPGDANTATVSLVYQKNDGSLVTLGSVTQAGNGEVKKSMGPFDVFATAGVPAGEQIVVVRLRAQKNAGADGTVRCWNLWTRLMPRRQ